MTFLFWSPTKNHQSWYFFLINKVFNLTYSTFFGITDPAIVLSLFMLTFIFVIVCGIFEWKWICARFISCLYRCTYQELSRIIKRESISLALIGLTSHHCVPLPSQGLDLPSVFVLIFSELRWEVIVCSWKCWPILFKLSFHNAHSVKFYIFEKDLNI